MGGHGTSRSVTAEEALRLLKEGNGRFVSGRTTFPTDHKGLLDALVRGQAPFATILGCSDSRVPPEIVFDAPLGSLFVIRVAGNVVSPEIAGTFQYAGTHLETSLFVVLGHEGCGAVQAALARRFRGARERDRIALLLERILPALDGIDPHAPPEEQAARAVEANVRWTVRQILDTPEGRERQAEGRYRLVGAVFELSTGRVRFLDDESS